MPAAKSAQPRKDFVNRINKTFDSVLAKAQAEAEAELAKTQATLAKSQAAAPSGAAIAAPVAVDDSNDSTSLPVSALFAAMAMGPCVALFQSPRFGVTLAENGALLVVVALVAQAALMQAYDAHVDNARRSGKRKSPTAALQNYAIFFVNLCFLVLFLVVGFFVLPTIGGLLPVPNEVTYFASVAGSAVFVYLWQKGLILKGLA
jgi:hypothetical protein